MKDSFYTPSTLAKHLLTFVKKRKVNSVADFCVGDGELLRAAVGKWRNAKCYGTDISKRAIDSVKASHPRWNLAQCDFLNHKARSKSAVLKKPGGYDLILLNPPFSCIGGSRNEVYLDGILFEASTAMTFVAESLQYLSVHGIIYAILPNSVAYSQKDKALWEVLVKNYNLSILEESDVKHFASCSARVILVSINTKVSDVNRVKFNRLKFKKNGLSVFRGKVGMHTVYSNTSTGNYLVHSTNLQNNKIENLKAKVNKEVSKVTGPAVLIPRVGLPSIQKICVLNRNTTYALSDCVLAVKTKTMKDSNWLKSEFIKNWNDVSELYKGTGARYITVERLEKYLGLSE